MGLAEEAEEFAGRSEASPFLKRYLALAGPADNEAAWRRKFERLTGLDLDLFETLQANRIPASEMARQGTGEIRLVSAEKKLLPQRYRVRLRFINPSGVRGSLGRLEFISRTAAAERRQVFPVELDETQIDGSSVLLSIDVPEAGAESRFELILDKDQGARFQGLDIYPDIRAHMSGQPRLTAGLAGTGLWSDPDPVGMGAARSRTIRHSPPDSFRQIRR